MDNLKNSKMLHAFSLPNVNFKTQMNLTVDADTHIKNIINCEAYISDMTTECLSNKCILRGTLGVKIVYVDLDNMLNAVTTSSDFNETVSHESLTANCKVFSFNEQVSPQITFDEKSFKININTNLKLYSIIDLNLNLANTDMEDLIVKNREMSVLEHVSDLSNVYSDNLELNIPFKVNKVLSTELNSFLEKAECDNGYITIEGQTISRLICEVESEEHEILKTFCKTDAFKYQIKCEEASADCIAQLILKANSNNIEFTSELSENGTIIKLDYEIKTSGLIFKVNQITCPDDVYSTKNELETSYSEREFCLIKKIPNFQVSFDGELQLGEEINVDEILDLTNLSTLITQTYVSNNKITLEGVAYANLIYLNEEKDMRLLNIEFPFSVSKDCDVTENDELLDFNMTITSHKCKIKRGSTLMIDLEAEINLSVVTKNKENLLENINFKNEISYGDIAFQIVLAKENESVWDFCKRVHCKKEKIEETNKEIPPIFQGGEKIIIFR